MPESHQLPVKLCCCKACQLLAALGRTQNTAGSFIHVLCAVGSVSNASVPRLGSEQELGVAWWWRLLRTMKGVLP